MHPLPVLLKLSVLCILIGLAAPIRADATADARKAIQAAYTSMDAAIGRKDANAVLANYAPTYVHIGKGGKKQNLDYYRRLLPQMLTLAQTIKSKSIVQKIALKG